MADTAKADPSLPKEIGGYTIVSRLGQGGMVDAYRATNVDGTVALRVVRKDAKMPGAMGANDREVAILTTPMLAQARHVAHYVAHGVDPLHGSWIATQFVNGMTLQDLLVEGKVPENDALEIVMSLCDALDELAVANIVHRDLKPNNIMLVRVEAERRWIAVLIDFNIAIQSDSIPKDEEGKIAGTTAFMSPEQCRGGRLTTTSDMFSLGCLLFGMLTGRTPMADPKGNQMKTLGIRATAEEPPKRPSEISQEIWNALESALHPDPSRRIHPTAFKLLLSLVRYGPGREAAAAPEVSGVVEALAHAMPSAPTATLPPPPPKPPPAGKLKQAASIAGILAILFLAAVGALTLATSHGTTESRENEVVVTTSSTEEDEDAGIPADASTPPPRRTRAPTRRAEAPRRPSLVQVGPPATPQRPPQATRGTLPAPVEGARVLRNGNYRIPHPDDWCYADVRTTRPQTCQGLRANHVRETSLFCDFCGCPNHPARAVVPCNN